MFPSSFSSLPSSSPSHLTSNSPSILLPIRCDPGMPLPNASDASHHLRGEVQSPCMVFPFSFSSLTIFPPIIPFRPRMFLFNSLNGPCSLPPLCSEHAVSLSKEVVCKYLHLVVVQQGHFLWVTRNALITGLALGGPPLSSYSVSHFPSYATASSLF